MIAVPVSLLIFILLYIQFRKTRTIDLFCDSTFCNWVFSFSVARNAFSISAGVGFIALFGVAVLNGLVLIAEFNSIRKSGETDLKIVYKD
jgi:cobalt-zinc-cadmium resistance protein CzcA